LTRSSGASLPLESLLPQTTDSSTIPKPRRCLSLALCGWALCGSGVSRFGGAGGWWRAQRDPGRIVRRFRQPAPVRLDDVQCAGGVHFSSHKSGSSLALRTPAGLLLRRSLSPLRCDSPRWCLLSLVESAARLTKKIATQLREHSSGDTLPFAISLP
jgi:hypothetical protein